MAVPKNAELELVRRAVKLGHTIGGCCEWQERAARRVRSQGLTCGLTPEGVKELLCRFVAVEAGEILQVAEKRAEYGDRRFYYKAILPVQDSPRGLFVELILVDDDDPEYPVVHIVNAHEQGR